VRARFLACIDCFFLISRKDDEARDRQARIQREREEAALKKLEEEEKRAAEALRAER